MGTLRSWLPISWRDARLLFSDLLLGAVPASPPLSLGRVPGVQREVWLSLLLPVYSFPLLILPEGSHMVECSESGPRAGAALAPGTVQQP